MTKKTEKDPREELIQELKKQHGDVWAIECDNNVCYVKKPNRDTMARAIMHYNGGKLLEAGETLLDNCFIHGDEVIRNDDMKRVAAAMQIWGIVEQIIPEVSLKKL